MSCPAPDAATGLTPARRANLARLLAPRHVLLMGGAHMRGVLRNLRQHGFAGEIFVVNPRRADLDGVPCLASLADLPVAPDAAYLGVNAEATIAAVAQLAAMGAGGVIAYASGFSELGARGAARHAALVAAAGDLALIGPNCYGIVNHVHGASLWPVAYPALEGRRGAAVIAQSGNVTIHLTSNQRSVPFSYLISAGNQAVLGFEDYITHLADDPAVTCIGLFLEGIRDVPAFSRAVIAAQARGKPVVVCRVGRSALGAAMAASHTSSLAGRNDHYAALFARLNVIDTDTVPQFLEMLKLASAAPAIGGLRVAAFSSSGGDNGLAADCLSLAGFSFPQPDAGQVAQVAQLLPDYAGVSNPLDFTAGYWGNEELLTPIFAAMLRDVDLGLMVMDFQPPDLGPESVPPIMAMIRALAAAGRQAGRPVAVASVNPESIPRGAREWMLAAGVMPLQGLHDAGEVLARWVRWRSRAGQEPRPLPALPAPFGAARTLDEAESRARLARHGLPVPQGRLLTADALADLPADLGGRFALKVCDARLPHKTEVGGVALDLAGRDEVLAAARRMADSIARHDATITPAHFLLEPMQPPPLAELIVGVQRDPLFGLVLVVGAGGVLVELLGDARPLLLPVTRAEVEGALRGLRSFALLDGFRGRPVAKLAPLVDAVMAVADYAMAHADSVQEIDVNPLMVHADHVVAVDALIVERRG